jgi:hypothetical protein
MKTRTYGTLLFVLALLVMSAATSQAQTEHQQEGGDKKTAIAPIKKGQKFLDQEMVKLEVSSRTNEPHFVMAMAYLQTIASFAKTLQDQAAGDRQLSADFARAAVDEIIRSLDKAKDHRQEHLKTMSPDIRVRLAAMIKAMDLQHAKLKDAVDVLDKDVRNYTLDAKQIATDSTAILKQLDALSKMNNEN